MARKTSEDYYSDLERLYAERARIQRKIDAAWRRFVEAEGREGAEVQAKIRLAVK